MTIDITKYKRDRDKIFKSLLFKKDTVIAKEDLYIMFPKKYIDLGLGVIDNTVEVYGVISISNDKDSYAIWTVPAIVTVTPSSIEVVDINDEDYYRLTVMKNDPVFDTLSVVVKSEMSYETFNMLLVKGNVPWYVGYEDLLTIFKMLPKYTSGDMTPYMTIIKVMIGVSARDGDNPNIPFRKSLKSKADSLNKKIYWAGLNNVYYTFSSTASKVFGSYMKAGMISAIIKPEKQATKLENIIRR